LPNIETHIVTLTFANAPQNAWGISPQNREVLAGRWWSPGWWFQAPLANMKVSWDDEIPNMWKNKKCSKPTRYSSLVKKLSGKITPIT